MDIAVIAFTANGGRLAGYICNNISHLRRDVSARGYVISKYCGGALIPFDFLAPLVDELWEKCDALVFIGACGIAVRAVASHIRDKACDRAVVVSDEKGMFAIPVLSGHIGGANDLARDIALITNGTAVITTATDINNKFSVDTFALKHKLHIGDTKLIKEISARILNGGSVGLSSGYYFDDLPDCFTDNARAGICISEYEEKPFEITLNLIPKNIIIGIGCRKSCGNVEESVLKFLSMNNLSVHAVRAAATIDVKKEEKGIMELCSKYSLPLLTFSAKELNAVHGSFTASEFVKKTVGTDNVCERAVRAAGADVVHGKTVINGVTVAAGKLR